MAEIGLFKLLLSDQILVECKRNLLKKLSKALPVFEQIIKNIDPEILPDPSFAESSLYFNIIEAKDAPILAAALLAKVDRLLSLNTKDFTKEVSVQTAITIQTPSEFIQEIREVITQGLSKIAYFQ